MAAFIIPTTICMQDAACYVEWGDVSNDAQRSRSRRGRRGRGVEERGGGGRRSAEHRRLAPFTGNEETSNRRQIPKGCLRLGAGDVNGEEAGQACVGGTLGLRIGNGSGDGEALRGGGELLPPANSADGNKTIGATPIAALEPDGAGGGWVIRSTQNTNNLFFFVGTARSSALAEGSGIAVTRRRRGAGNESVAGGQWRSLSAATAYRRGGGSAGHSLARQHLSVGLSIG